MMNSQRTDTRQHRRWKERATDQQPRAWTASQRLPTPICARRLHQTTCSCIYACQTLQGRMNEGQYWSSKHYNKNLIAPTRTGRKVDRVDEITDSWRGHCGIGHDFSSPDMAKP